MSKSYLADGTPITDFSEGTFNFLRYDAALNRNVYEIVEPKTAPKAAAKAAAAAPKAKITPAPTLNAQEQSLLDYFLALDLILSEKGFFTERMVADICNDRFGKNFIYSVVLAHGEWMRWTGHTWHSTSAGKMRDKIIQLSKDIRNKVLPSLDPKDKDQKEYIDPLNRLADQLDGVEFVGKVIKWLEGMREINFQDFDQKPYLFNFANGTYDLTTQTFRDFDPEDLLTQKAAVAYRVGAECPMFHKFLENSFPSQSVREYLQRWFGYCLTATGEEKAAPIFHGHGDNGKTILLEIMMAIFGYEGNGAYGRACEWDTFATSKNGNLAIRNDLARLHNARVVFCDESQRGMELNEGIFKKVTGNSKVTSRFLNKEFFTYQAGFKLILATNNRPAVVGGGDPATWARIHDIKMEQQFPVGDPRRIDNLRALLMDEREGIAQWMIEGYRQYVEKGGLYPPQEVTDSTAEYQQHSDMQGEFFLDECVVGNGLSVKLNDLYNQHKVWSKRVGEKPLKLQEVVELLNARKFKVERKVNEDGRPNYVYGLSLRDTTDVGF